MRYLGIAISVGDVNASRKFYEELFGTEVYQDYGLCVGFSCGLSLQQDFDKIMGVPKEKMVRDSNNMELYFEEENFDGFLKKLERHPEIRYLHRAREQPWGQRSIRFYDPDGHLIEVGENMKAVISRFLSSGMSMEAVSKRMGVSVADLEKLLKE